MPIIISEDIKGRPSKIYCKRVLLYLFWEKIINNLILITMAHIHKGYVGATFKTIFKKHL